MRNKIFIFIALLCVSLTANVCVIELTKIGNRINRNAFEIRRGMGEYRVNFGKEFEKLVSELTKDDLWIDSGAGASLAIAERYIELEDFRTLPDKIPHTLSITVKRPTIEELIEKEKQLQTIPFDFSEKTRREYYRRRFQKLDNYTESGHHEFKEGYLESIPNESIKKAKLITDSMGPFSYTKDMPGTIRKYLQMLQTGGSVLINTNQNKTSIFTDKPELLFNWISKNVKGAEAIQLTPSTIQLKRNSDAIEVTDLHLFQMNDGAPPSRAYESVK